MDAAKEIIKIINSMSGAKTPYDIFYDWVHIFALAIANSSTLIHDAVWQAREEEYKQTVRPYGKACAKFAELAALLTELMDESMGDHLGRIYMLLNMGNKETGQFFTPYPVSRMMAGMVLPDEIEDPCYMNEPACGAGGMIIAAADELKRRGINYQTRLKVVAQDLDWRAVYMCYIQLSLYGINAVVVQGNTLADPDWRTRPKDCIFKTPMNMACLW